MAQGALRDSGINAISVLTRLLPQSNNLRVNQAKWEVPPGSEAETKVEVTFGFDSGAGTLSMDWTYPGKEVRSFQFATPSGNILVDLLEDTLAAEYERMLRHFASCATASESFCPLKEIRILNSIRSVAVL
jgi:predicted dehydrogenase